MAPFAASDPAIISASHEESATEACFFEPHAMVAELYLNTNPDVECCTAQSESDMPERGASSGS